MKKIMLNSDKSRDWLLAVGTCNFAYVYDNNNFSITHDEYEDQKRKIILN